MPNIDDFKNKIILGDCLEVMKDIPNNSVDMILCDLPYSIEGRPRFTGNKWDIPINIEKLWTEYKRIIKNTGAIALTASQPFSSYLVMSNIEMFKYEWVWEKDNGTNFTSVNYQPFKIHENVLIFSSGATTYTKNGNFMKYNPQKTIGKPYVCKSGISNRPNLKGGNCSGHITANNGSRHPKTIQKFIRDKDKLHPTQKPVKLFEYLIKTYTNKGELVLDNCIGSGTTAISALNTGRYFIGIEKDENYHKIACERVNSIKHI